MARKIGVVSPKFPHSAHITANISQNSSVYWFLELEGLFAFLFQHSLDELWLDESLCKDDHRMAKYQKLIKQMYPKLKLGITGVKNSGGGQELGGGQLFPPLDIVFKHGELLSVFQPIVEPQVQGHPIIYGYECLSRVRCYGSLYTPEFLFNYAQEKLELTTYDKICLMQALSLVPSHEKALIFVNIRPQTLISTNFYGWFKDLLKKHQISPEQIVLEITEQFCVVPEQEMTIQCNELKKQGLRMAVDDFGSGISNLSMLEIMKPDFIKISGRFTKSSHVDHNKQKIIKNVLDLANAFNINAIVENVENNHEWQAVTLLGARFAQGFHFFKPMTKHELCALL